MSLRDPVVVAREIAERDRVHAIKMHGEAAIESGICAALVPGQAHRVCGMSIAEQERYDLKHDPDEGPRHAKANAKANKAMAEERTAWLLPKAWPL